MNRRKIVIAIAFSMIMMLSAFAVLGAGQSGQAAANLGSTNLSTQASNPQVSGATPWQMPTTTMQEPGYTNGTFNMGIDCNVGSMNYFTSDTYCDVYVTDEIYDSMYSDLPSGVSIPWLATNYSVTPVTHNNQTFDIVTNSEQNYSYVYTVNLRPYVQWTDWSAANATQTYTFSNHSVYDFNGKSVSHTFKSFNSITMKKYYLQSADVVLSWRLQSDFGSWPNVVSVVPKGNLSVEIFVTKKTLLFQTDVLANDILPYHIWAKHDFTSIPGLFNCTPGIKSGNGYYDWNLGWNSATGLVPGLVGTGPFMVTNNYGLPQGKIIPSQSESFYVNPHYFVQYAKASSGLRQYTPKFYKIYMPYYSSESAMVAAYAKGQIDTTSTSVGSSFYGQIASTPGSHPYRKPSSSYGYFRLDTAVAPLNITAFRQALNYATPYSYIETTVAGGYGYHLSSVINPHNFLYYNTSALNYNFNMKKAQEKILSIPGMVNTSGKLYYNDKPVSLQIQTTVGSVAPGNIQSADATCSYWKALGISTSLKEEAFTTLEANIDGTIGSYNTTTGTYSSNLYQIGELGLSTATGDPALDCQELMTPQYGISTYEFVGPFSNLTAKFNGKSLSGPQVQDLMDNLTAKLVNTNKQSKAEQYAKQIQSLNACEATSVITGYGTDIVPELDHFTNYSHSNSEAVYLYWYWQFFSIYNNPNAVAVHYNYSLDVKATINNATTEYSGDKATVTFMVTNNSTNDPVVGANIIVSISAPYGGIVNTTSPKLTTSKNGEANFSYKVFSPLRQILLDCNGTTGNNYNLYYEEVVITGYANVTHAKQTGPGNGNVTVWLVNPSLDISCTPSQPSFTAGEQGSIVFFVSENGTGVQGATVSITPTNYLNMSFNATDLSLTTNSTGYAVFTFTVNSNVTSFYNATFLIKASPAAGASVSGHSVLATPNATFEVQLEKKTVSSSSSSLLLYAEIGGGVAAAVIVIGVAVYMIRKPKVPLPKGENSGSGTSGS